MSESRLFFDAFSDPSTADWTREIEREIQTRLSLASLDWTPESGITARPFYRQEDLIGEYHPLSRDTPGWIICDCIYPGEGDDLCAEAERARTAGADALVLSVSHDITIQHIIQYTRMEEGLPLLVLVSQVDFIAAIKGCAAERPVSPVSFLHDPFVDNKLPFSEDFTSLFDELTVWFNTLESADSDIHLGSLDGRSYAWKGGDLITTSACILAGLERWCSLLAERGVQAQTVARSLRAIVPVGTSFLPEIARIRALSHLFPQVVQAFEGAGESVVRPKIHAMTSECSLSGFDVHTNLIRTTTQAMAAILGGCDSLSVARFDLFSSAGSAIESRRLSRNVQLLLRDESYLDRVTDPLSGSYTVEALTDLMIEAIWSRFLEIQDAGGLTEATSKGLVTKWIDDDRKRLQEAGESGRRRIVGVTAYPNTQEGFLHPSSYNIPDTNGHIFRPGSGVETIRQDILKRISNGLQVPTFNLFATGSATEKSQSLLFASNFLGCGGFPVSASPIEPIDASLDDCVQSDASFVVLCASPDDWEHKLSAFTDNYRQLGGSATVLFASYGDLDSDALDEDSSFVIHSGSHLLRTFERLITLAAEVTNEGSG